MTTGINLKLCVFVSYLGYLLKIDRKKSCN